MQCALTLSCQTLIIILEHVFLKIKSLKNNFYHFLSGHHIMKLIIISEFEIHKGVKTSCEFAIFKCFQDYRTFIVTGNYEAEFYLMMSEI